MNPQPDRDSSLSGILVALVAISAVTLAVVAIPARRAARIEPAAALRSD